MRDPENADLCSAGPSSTWSGFENLQISEVVETTCSSLGTGRQRPETLPRQFRESHPDFSDGPWTLVRFFTDEILPEGFDLDRLLSDSAIMINTVPHIVEHKHAGSYELVVATPCLDLLSEKFQDFKLVVDYDPFEPAEEDIRIHGIRQAKRKARINTLNNAAEVTRNGWGHGPAECYRSVVGKAGLGKELARAILNWDVQHSVPRILKHFTRNLLFFCLNCCDRYDSPSALDILGRDQKEWLQPFRNGHTHLSELWMAADVPVGAREGLEQQTTSLFQSILEFSSGKVDIRQHDFGTNYTTSQNASLCASLLGIFYSRQFRRFDPEGMQAALSKSKLFAKSPKSDIPDVLEWKLRMMNLPSQLLCGFSARQVDQIRFQLEHTYCRLPSLWKEKNNLLLLLTWSSRYHGQTLEVLSDWIKSEESLNLYQRMIEDLWLQQTPEEFALTLAALLCRERLLPYNVDDTTQPIGGSYLADLDAILNRQEISNRRTVFEQMILSLVRVLYTLNNSEETVRLLVKVLDKEASLLEPLDGVADQYCARKLDGHNHNKAFEEAREGFLKCVEAMLRRDRNADAEWMVIPRLPLQLVSAL
ncbi:MAG: hypothetical protein LQ352_000126 [Teloschistes flavicans]|nr:MAG: hypothetical protein LQ352_000126 [Teloschistes flavicans]